MENKANNSFEIYHDLLINVPVSDVFEVVTMPKHLIQWWPLKCTGTPVVGGEYNFYFTPEYDWFASVIEHSENKTFQLQMIKADTDWNGTIIGFDMCEIKGNTQLRFWHKDWPKCNDHYRRSSFCWATLLNALKNYLEKGIVIPFEERE